MPTLLFWSLCFFGPLLKWQSRPLWAALLVVEFIRYGSLDLTPCFFKEQVQPQSFGTISCPNKYLSMSFLIFPRPNHCMNYHQNDDKENKC